MASESINLLEKHVRAAKTYYVDLDFMEPGVTVVSASADTADASLTIADVAVITVDTTIDDRPDCAEVQLKANRAIEMILADGVADDDEVIVTVNWVQSDGGIDSRDCRLIVSGTA